MAAFLRRGGHAVGGVVCERGPSRGGVAAGRRGAMRADESAGRRVHVVGTPGPGAAPAQGVPVGRQRPGEAGCYGGTCPPGLTDGASRHWPLPGYPATPGVLPGYPAMPGAFPPAVALTPVCQTWFGYCAVRPWPVGAWCGCMTVFGPLYGVTVPLR